MKKKICITCKSEKYENIENFEFRKDIKKFRGECKLCTRARQRTGDKSRYDNMSEDEKSEYISKKVESNRRRLKTGEIALAKKRLYDKSDKGIFVRYRNDANRRGRCFSFELNLDQFSALVNGNCFYCGKENCRGVDRYDSKLGYTLNNSVSCCARCNEIKMDKSAEEMYSHLVKMIKHMENKVVSNIIAGSSKVMAPM